MYGTSPTPFPERVVCLSADTAEVAFAVGAGDRVVGVPGTVRRPPEARERPRVGGFTTFRLDRILALRPDLALACSDLQADVVRELVRAAVPVVAVNPRSVRDIFQAILVVGGALGCEGGFANQDCIHHIALGGLIGGAVGFGLGAFVGSFIPKADPAAGAPSEPH